MPRVLIRTSVLISRFIGRPEPVVYIKIFQFEYFCVSHLKVDFKALVVHLGLKGDEMKLLSDDQ